VCGEGRWEKEDEDEDEGPGDCGLILRFFVLYLKDILAVVTCLPHTFFLLSRIVHSCLLKISFHFLLFM
jgi:hypothetical protein